MALLFAVISLLLSSTVLGRHENAGPPGLALSKRTSNASDLQVDLGYEIYEGYYNASFGLNTWLGVRYAAPPLGNMRWRAPHQPEVNRDQIIQADAFPPRCPQGPQAPIAPGYNYTGSEDCLFLSVYAPANKTNLPVSVACPNQ